MTDLHEGTDRRIPKRLPGDLPTLLQPQGPNNINQKASNKTKQTKKQQIFMPKKKKRRKKGGGKKRVLNDSTTKKMQESTIQRMLLT